MGKSKYVITVTRQFGSMGRPIAKKMSELLGIEYYDRDIVEEAAKTLHLPVSTVDEEEESARKMMKLDMFHNMAFPLGRGTSDIQDKIFVAQQGIIRFLAEKDTCVIVGRCADFVLADMENCIHIYIYASFESRLEHCIHDLGMDEDDARKTMRSVDEARTAYHMNYTGYAPDDKRHKDIMIDSSLLGVDETAKLLADIVRRKFGGEQNK